MKRKIWIPVVVLIGLAAAAFFVYPSLKARSSQTTTSYQTEAATKGSISESVGGTGSVRANQSATISWQTSGTVSKVSVKKGQQVAADTMIAELDERSLSQSVMQARVDLLNAQTDLDKAINNNQARADTHLALIQAQQDLNDAEKEAQSKLYQRASQETIDIARANLIQANAALNRAEETYNMTKNAGSDTEIYAAGLTQYAKARQLQQQAVYNYRYVSELPDPLSVEESNIKVDQAKAALLAAKQDWEKVKDGPDADKVLAAQTRLDIAQATLDQIYLKAPFAGAITHIDSKTGDLVKAGTVAVEINDLSHLFVDVDISEVDISQVKVGQAASMTFDALTGQEFTGTVTDIASTGASTNGTVNFNVTVEIQNPTIEIKPGMTAAINVTVNQLNDVLLVPSRAVRTVNGQRVVYVLKNDQLVTVNVVLGASANNYSQITQGDVIEGDLVVLNPPSGSQFPMGGPSGMRGN
jgi:HlyD family secretion protein